MTISRNIKEIKLNKLFIGVSEDIIKSVFKSDDFREVREGDVIYQTGDEADRLYLLLRGEAKIKFPTHHYISNKFFNDFFGEKELFDNTRRNSSAVANKNCLLYQVKAEKLKNLMDATEGIKENINTYGEVVLPDIEPASQNRINLSNSDKPISFKATAPEIKKQDEPITGNITIPDAMQDTIDIELGSPASELEIDDKEINIQENGVSNGIELEIPPVSHEEIVNPADEKNVNTDLAPGQIEIEEILDTLLITHNQLSIFDTIQSILFAFKKLTSSRAGEIFIVNENAGEMIKYMEDSGSLKIKHYKISEGLTGTSVLQKRTLNFDEPTEDSRFVEEIDKPGDLSLKKILYVPLAAKNNVIVGVLQLARDDEGYSNSEIMKIESISGHAAAAIERGKRFEQLVEEEKHKSNKSIYNFLEENISIPADIINSYASILKKGKSIIKDKGILILLQLQVKLFREVVKTTFNFNKPDFSLNLDKANLSSFLQGASELLSEYCGARNINLFRKTNSPAIVKFNPGGLYMAIYQLIKNACDASEQSGNVFISLETDSDFAKIIITDEGTGIEDYRKSNLFNTDFDIIKGRNRFGLAIAEKIVSLHSGKIKFTSVQNEGSIFTISLPLIETEEIPSLLDHFEPAFKLDESENDFSEYLTDDLQDIAEDQEN